MQHGITNRFFSAAARCATTLAEVPVIRINTPMPETKFRRVQAVIVNFCFNAAWQMNPDSKRFCCSIVTIYAKFYLLFRFNPFHCITFRMQVWQLAHGNFHRVYIMRPEFFLQFFRLVTKQNKLGFVLLP